LLLLYSVFKDLTNPATAIFGFLKAIQKTEVASIDTKTNAPACQAIFSRSSEERSTGPDEKAAAFSLSLYQRRRRVIIPDWREKSTLFFNYFFIKGYQYLL
jgi:hypothetical protein